MAKKKNENRQFDDAIERGQKNAQLAPSVRDWCRHLNIEMTSAGLLAEMTGLPIGSHRVTCPHGVGLIESQDLASTARGFILKNCATCSHHQEVAPNNFGRQVFERKQREDQQKEEALALAVDQRSRLLEEAQKDLDSSEAPQQSIHDLVLAFQEAQISSTEYQNASEQLRQSAQVAPEHFGDGALKVLLNPPSQSYGHLPVGLAVARLVCAHRNDVPDFVFHAASRSVSESYDMGGEAACGLLLDYVRLNGTESVVPLLPRLLYVANFRLAHFMMSPIIRAEPLFPNALNLIRVIFEDHPEAGRKEFSSRLRIDDKNTKLNTAKVLQRLLPELASEILPLFDVVLHSLSLEDDQYEESADAEICELLAHLYAFAPELCEEKMTSFWKFASDEVKVLLCRVYTLLLDATSRTRWIKPVFTEEKYENCVSLAIEKLLLALGDVRLDVKVREDICQEIEYVVDKEASNVIQRIMLSKLDRLLGRLAMTLQEAKQVPNSDEAKTQMEWYERDNKRLKYDSLVRKLTKIIRSVIAYNPSQTFPIMIKALSQTSSKNQAVFKSCLVGTLKTFALDEELAPQVVPELYRHLTDYESNLVRSRAIDVLGEMLDKVPQYVPTNMLEWLFVCVRDPYVVIHRHAVRALEHVRLRPNDSNWEVLTHIVNWEASYSQNKGESEWQTTDFLKQIVRTLSAAFRDWPGVSKIIVTQWLPKYARHENVYFAEEMLARLASSVSIYPQVADQFAELALEYLSTTQERHHQDDDYGDRGRIWRAFIELPTATLLNQTEGLKEVARCKAEHTPWETFRVLELMSGVGLHQETLSLAEEFGAATPEGKANDWRRQTYLLIAEAERAEIMCAQGQNNRAMQALEKAEKAVPKKKKEVHEELEEMWRDGLIESL